MSDHLTYDTAVLFKQVAVGEEPAFRKVFELYRGKLYYFLHILQDHDQAQEALKSSNEADFKE